MTRELTHGVARRFLTVVAVLLGLFLAHGLSGSLAGASTHHATVGAYASSMREMTTTASSRVATVAVAGAAAASAVGIRTAFEARVQGQPDGKQSGMDPTGLCLAFLTILLLSVLAVPRLRPWAVLGGGTWRPTVPRPLPVRCNAPDLHALGVLRC